jgi:uncharacterized protein YkwD
LCSGETVTISYSVSGNGGSVTDVAGPAHTVNSFGRSVVIHFSEADADVMVMSMRFWRRSIVGVYARIGDCDPDPDPTTPSTASTTTTSTAPSPPGSDSTTTTSTAPSPPGSDPTTTTTAPTTTASVAPPTTVPPTTAPSTSETSSPSGGVNAVELEILRLTNELRADPAGALARQKPMPSCVNESFYNISVDPSTGHPEPVAALTLSEAVSLSMARPWAEHMDATGVLEHRSSSSALEIYGQLGIGVSATGENIAWFAGYPDSEAARIHFEGWRESDSGHYCALISPTYTHVGVGHYKGSTRSWAVQNFYRTR